MTAGLEGRGEVVCGGGGWGGGEGLLDEVNGGRYVVPALHDVRTGDVVSVKVHFADERGPGHAQGTEDGVPNL